MVNAKQLPNHLDDEHANYIIETSAATYSLRLHIPTDNWSGYEIEYSDDEFGDWFPSARLKPDEARRIASGAKLMKPRKPSK